MADDDGASPVEVSGAITVTDVLGIGKAISSPAAREIVRAFSSPLQIYLEGKAKANALKTAMVTEAKAEVQAALIRDESRELLQRTAKRLIAQEAAKQVNIESAVERAIEHLESGPQPEGGTARTLDENWLLRWTEGAQYANSDTVRELWARILATQAQGGSAAVSGPSLALLQYLDQRLANSFSEFVRLMATYGCVPWRRPYSFFTGYSKAFEILQEIGFLVENDTVSYSFIHFDILQRTPRLPYPHTSLRFSNRGAELAESIFGPDPLTSGPLKGTAPTEGEQISTLVEVVSAMIEKNPMGGPAILRFKDAQGVPVADILFGKKTATLWDDEGSVAKLKARGAVVSEIGEKVVRALEEKYTLANITEAKTSFPN